MKSCPVCLKTRNDRRRAYIKNAKELTVSDPKWMVRCHKNPGEGQTIWHRKVIAAILKREGLI